MGENIKNHIIALMWNLVIIGIGFFAFYDFGIEGVKGFLKSLGDKPVFLFYLGSIFALLVFVIEDLFRKPNFKINIGTINETPNGDWRFLHVNVINLDWPKWSFLFRRNLAKSTTAEITFQEKDTGKIMFSMQGRWSTNLEPINQQVVKTTEQLATVPMFDQQLARQATLTDISPSTNLHDLREGKLVISFKSKDEEACYGFNNESYIRDYWTHDERPFRNTNHKIGRGEFDVEVVIRSGRTIARKYFIIENFGNSIDKMILKAK